MSQVLKKEVEKGLAAICNRIGFKKKQYYFIKPIDDNVIATLNFGFILHKAKGHVFIDIGVGVFHKFVEELYAKLTGIDKSVFKYTISLQIGDLMPGNSFKEWDFAENADNSYLYEDMLKNIQTYGFAYQEKMKDFDNLLEAFEKRVPGILNQARDRYLPILYYLKGDKQRGLKAIEEAIEKQKKPLAESNIPKFSGAKEEITIIGSGIGKVDPEYLKFAENYKLL
ncbi:MAG: hypothetical protein QM786_15940 [Breznakibacter sp.]